MTLHDSAELSTGPDLMTHLLMENYVIWSRNAYTGTLVGHRNRFVMLSKDPAGLYIVGIQDEKLKSSLYFEPAYRMCARWLFQGIR